MSDLLLKEGQSNSFRSVECYWNVGGYMINHIEDPKCVFKTIQDKSTEEKSIRSVLIESYENLNAIVLVATRHKYRMWTVILEKVVITYNLLIA